VTTAMTLGSDSPRRCDVPLYTAAEAARYLDVPESTLRSWTTATGGMPAIVQTSRVSPS
jgi:hypothetical protein